jgi:hypothetical protein
VFLWRYFDLKGTQVGTSDRFSERAAAEDWMGTAWSDLLTSGVEEVALVDEELARTLYQMGLREK